MADTTEDALESAMRQPKTIEVDGQKVENRDVSDLIEADRYLASKKATRGRRCPVRLTRMIAGGALE